VAGWGEFRAASPVFTSAPEVVTDGRIASVRDTRLAEYRRGGDIFVADDRGGFGGDTRARADPDRLPLP
jgi:hypothetical protein